MRAVFLLWFVTSFVGINAVCPLTAAQYEKSSIGRTGPSIHDYFAPCNNGVHGDERQAEPSICGTTMEPTVQIVEHKCKFDQQCPGSNRCNTQLGRCNIRSGDLLKFNLVPAAVYAQCAAELENHPRTYTLTVCAEKIAAAPAFDFRAVLDEHQWGGRIPGFMDESEHPPDPSGACAGGGANGNVDGLACVRFHSISDLSTVKIALHREPSAGTDDIMSDIHMHLQEHVTEIVQEGTCKLLIGGGSVGGGGSTRRLNSAPEGPCTSDVDCSAPRTCVGIITENRDHKGLWAKKRRLSNADNGGWSSWSACSAPCNTGQRYRTCTAPEPAPGGNDCSALDGGYNHEECNTETCVMDDRYDSTLEGGTCGSNARRANNNPYSSDRLKSALGLAGAAGNAATGTAAENKACVRYELKIDSLNAMHRSCLTTTNADGVKVECDSDADCTGEDTCEAGNAADLLLKQRTRMRDLKKNVRAQLKGQVVQLPREFYTVRVDRYRRSGSAALEQNVLVANDVDNVNPAKLVSGDAAWCTEMTALGGSDQQKREAKQCAISWTNVNGPPYNYTIVAKMTLFYRGTCTAGSVTNCVASVTGLDQDACDAGQTCTIDDFDPVGVDIEAVSKTPPNDTPQAVGSGTTEAESGSLSLRVDDGTRTTSPDAEGFLLGMRFTLDALGSALVTGGSFGETVPDIVEHTDIQRTYSEAEDFAAYIQDTGAIRARVALKTYKYTAAADEMAQSIVHFGKCSGDGQFDAEVQLKRLTGTDAGAGISCAAGAACDFNADTVNRAVTENVKGLGNKHCYAMLESTSGALDGADFSGACSTTTSTACSVTGDCPATETCNTVHSYDTIFANSKLGAYYQPTANLDTGNYWKTATCAVEGGAGNNPAICSETTGDTSPLLNDFFADTGVADAGFRYVADVTMDEIRSNCDGVVLSTDATSGAETTTFHVAHEVIRASHRRGDTIANVDKKFVQHCQEHAYSVQVNKELRAVITGEFSKAITFKVLDVGLEQCASAAITAGSVSDPTLVGTGEPCDVALTDQQRSDAGCMCQGSVPAGTPVVSCGTSQGGYHKLSIKIRTEFENGSEADFNYIGLEDPRVSLTNQVNGINFKSGMLADNVYKFGSSAENTGGAATVALFVGQCDGAAELDTPCNVDADCTGSCAASTTTTQEITLTTDCINAASLDQAKQNECNPDAFKFQQDYSVKLRLRACSNQQCLAGGTDQTTADITYSNGEVAVANTCAAQCIDARSGSTDLTYPDGDQYFPLGITVTHSECAASFEQTDSETVAGMNDASGMLFASRFHPTRPADAREPLLAQVFDAGCVTTDAQCDTPKIVDGQITHMGSAAMTKFAARTTETYGEGQTVVAALVADKTSARLRWTTWVTTARVCQFESAVAATNAKTISAGLMGCDAGVSGIVEGKTYSLIDNGKPFSYEQYGYENWFKPRGCKYDKWAALKAAFNADTAKYSDGKFALGTNPTISDAHGCPDYFNVLGTSNNKYSSTNAKAAAGGTCGVECNCITKGTCSTTTATECIRNEDCPATESCNEWLRSEKCGRGQEGAVFTCDWDVNAGGVCSTTTSTACTLDSDCPSSETCNVGHAAWDAIAFDTDYLVGETTSYWVVDLQGKMVDCSSVAEPASLSRRLGSWSGDGGSESGDETDSLRGSSMSTRSIAVHTLSHDDSHPGSGIFLTVEPKHVVDTDVDIDTVKSLSVEFYHTLSDLDPSLVTGTNRVSFMAAYGEVVAALIRKQLPSLDVDVTITCFADDCPTLPSGTTRRLLIDYELVGTATVAADKTSQVVDQFEVVEAALGNTADLAKILEGNATYVGCVLTLPTCYFSSAAWTTFGSTYTSIQTKLADVSPTAVGTQRLQVNLDPDQIVVVIETDDDDDMSEVYILGAVLLFAGSIGAFMWYQTRQRQRAKEHQQVPAIVQGQRPRMVTSSGVTYGPVVASPFYRFRNFETQKMRSMKIAQ